MDLRCWDFVYKNLWMIDKVEQQLGNDFHFWNMSSKVFSWSVPMSAFICLNLDQNSDEIGILFSGIN